MDEGVSVIPLDKSAAKEKVYLKSFKPKIIFNRMARSRSHFTNLDLKKPNLLLSMCPWTSWTNAFEWLTWKWQHQSGRTSRDSNCSGSIGKTWLNSYLWHAFPCQNSPKQCDLACLLHGIQKAWKEAESTVLLFLSAWRWHNTHQNWGFLKLKMQF